MDVLPQFFFYFKVFCVIIVKKIIVNLNKINKIIYVFFNSVFLKHGLYWISLEFSLILINPIILLTYLIKKDYTIH
jgi:hypothetical protein